MDGKIKKLYESIKDIFIDSEIKKLYEEIYDEIYDKTKVDINKNTNNIINCDAIYYVLNHKHPWSLVCLIISGMIFCIGSIKFTNNINSGSTIINIINIINNIVLLISCIFVGIGRTVDESNFLKILSIEKFLELYDEEEIKYIIKINEIYNKNKIKTNLVELFKNLIEISFLITFIFNNILENIEKTNINYNVFIIVTICCVIHIFRNLIELFCSMMYKKVISINKFFYELEKNIYLNKIGKCKEPSINEFIKKLDLNGDKTREQIRDKTREQTRDKTREQTRDKTRLTKKTDNKVNLIVIMCIIYILKTIKNRKFI